MKKLFITMALGVFLSALSFMQANACTTPTHVTNPAAGVTLCQGSVVTITGSYGGATPYTMILLVDGIQLTTFTGTTSSHNFFYTVPIINSITGHSFQVYVAQSGCAPRFTYSAITNNLVDNSFYINSLTQYGSQCAIPAGYTLGLQYTDGAPYIYSLYRNSTLVSTLPGHADYSGITFTPNQTAAGTYSIYALNTATGCVFTEGDAGAQSFTILTVPGAPTLSYTWCGSGGLTFLVPVPP